MLWQVTGILEENQVGRIHPYLKWSLVQVVGARLSARPAC